MELRLVCVIMPRSREGLYWAPFESHPSRAHSSPARRGYGSSSLQPLPNGHDRGPPLQSSLSPAPVRLTYVPAGAFQASTPPCARMICEPELSCAGMCKGNPEQAHGHDCEVSGQRQHILLSILQVTVRCACTLKACMSVWMLCFFYSRLAAINLECNIQVLTHSLHPLTERSAVLNYSHLNGTAWDVWNPRPLQRASQTHLKVDIALRFCISIECWDDNMADPVFCFCL